MIVNPSDGPTHRKSAATNVEFRNFGVGPLKPSNWVHRKPAVAPEVKERVPGLGARTVQTTWLAASDPPQVFLVIDPDNGIAEINEGNNSASKWVQVNPRVSLPDLKIASGDVTFAPASPSRGEPTQVAVVVHNVGDKSSGASVLRLFDSDPRVGGRQLGLDYPLPAIIPGGISTAQLSLETAGLSGRIYVYALADPENALNEISETNNQAYAFVELRPPTLPDLVIGAGGLTFSPTPALEGETVNVTVQVQNHGLAASGVEVALYDGDPTAGGVALVSLQPIAGIFEQNGTRAVAFAWNTAGQGGNHLIYAVVDPNGKIAEYHENNNAQSLALNVVSAHLAVVVVTSGSVFGANMPVGIQVSAQNNGTALASALLEVEIEDSQGSQVAEVVSASLNLAAGEVRAVPCTWNTGVVLDGTYRVAARLLQQGRVVVIGEAPITITPDLTLTSTVVTDKTGYRSNETARIIWRVQSGSVNHDFTNLTATLTVADTAGGVLFTDQRAIPSLGCGQRLAFDTYWGVATRPPGAYPLSVRISDGTALLAQATGTLTISAAADPKTLLAGAITATPQVIFSGDAETLSYSIRNIGNRTLSQVHLSIKVVSTDQQTVHAELIDTTSLTMGAQHAASQILSTAGFSAADYLTVLVAEIDGVSATLAGTYFRIQGAPSAPSVNSPAEGSKVATFTPALIVNNAADPNALDKLTYFFELYTDSGLTQLMASAGPLAEGQGTIGWQVPVTLAENTRYWWRCRAYDSWAYGEWMSPASFFVNMVNDPPGPPTADHPLDGQSVAELRPLLAVKDAFDPDTESLTYNFRVATDSGLTNLVASVVGVFETPGTTAWEVNVPLAENSRYWWSAQADDWLSEGPWMAPVSFFVNTTNDAPTAPVPIAPAEGAVTNSSVTFEVQNATDPDSAVLTYLFEVDSDPAFTSAALISSPSLPEGAGMTSWTIPAVLTENTRYYWRAKANDGEADSPWSAVSAFFVNTVNEPPSTPALANPSAGGEVIVLQPALSVHNATDPDGDVLTYEFEIYADAGLAQRVVSVAGIAQGADGLTSWNVTQPLNENTRYWWRARSYVAAEVEELFGMPWRTGSRSLMMDIVKIMQLALSKDGSSDKTLGYMRSSGMTSSVLEHMVPERLFSQPTRPVSAISAVKALQMANDQGIPIYRITQANFATSLPQLSVADEVKTAIADAIGAGKEVAVSKSNIAYGGWSGCGYIVADPATGAAAYMISGGLSGAWAIYALAGLFFGAALATVLLAPAFVIAALLFALSGLMVLYPAIAMQAGTESASAFFACVLGLGETHIVLDLAVKLLNNPWISELGMIAIAGLGIVHFGECLDRLVGEEGGH